MLLLITIKKKQEKIVMLLSKYNLFKDVLNEVGEKK